MSAESPVDPRAFTMPPALLAGMVLAPIFYLVVLAQMAAREGFDISRHPISSLSLGDAGWIQVTNFLVTGLLALAAAFGLRRALAGGRSGRAGPGLVAAYGVGIIVAGLFRTDPALGFPPGTPDEMPATMSTSAVLHSLGFFVAFGSLTVACFVVARRFADEGDRPWQRFGLASGLAAPVLVAVGMANPDAAGVFFAVAGVVAFGWLSATCWRLASRPVASGPAADPT